ncbi:MAG: AI-2E family transporter [Ruminococcus sp.]|nr:AI-2E family transporter [Ruminococcus sp.]
MKIDWKTCLRVGASAFLLYLCIHYWENLAHTLGLVLSAAFPLVLGGVIAYVINIPMSFYERHYFLKSKKKAAAVSRRPVCMLLAYLTVLAVAALIIWLILPQLAECVKVILAELPAVLQTVVAYAEEFRLLPENIIDLLSDIDWKSSVGNIIEVLTSGIGNIMSTVLSMAMTVFSGIVTALVSVIFSAYILLSKDTLSRQWKRFLKRYLKEKWSRRISEVLFVLNDSFRRYIVGQCTEAVVLGVLCAVGMMIFGFPYALMIGALMAFTALIPVAGAYIGAGIGAFMILTESPFQALLFLVFIVILQQLEGNLIYPRVVGSSIGLPGLWVLAAVTVGGGVLGIPGMLLGVPIAAAIYRMLREHMNQPSHAESL